MTIFSGELDTAPEDQDIGSLPTGFWAARGAAAGGGLAEGTTSELQQSAAIKSASQGTGFNQSIGSFLFPSATILSGNAEAPTPEIPIEQARQRVKAARLDGQIDLGDQPTIREGALNLMIDGARERAERATTIARGPGGVVAGALDVGTSVLTGAVDPVNVAAFSIPVLGEARYGQLMERAGQSVVNRFAVRAGVGALQGAAGSAVLTPLDWAARTEEGRDYTFADALSGVIQNAGIGGVMHAGGGALADIYARLRGLPLKMPGEANAGIPPAPSPDAGGQAAAPPATAAQAQTGPGGQPAPSPGKAAPGEASYGLVVTTGRPEVDAALGRPEVEAAITQGSINRDYDVPYGAGASRDNADVTYVDRHVPAEAEINGVTFDPAKFVQIHEQVEAWAMKDLGLSYPEAHTMFATPAERAAVEAALGHDAWRKYSELWDGWLSKIEHENPESPPPDLFDKPYPPSERLALERRAAAEGGETAQAAVSPPDAATGAGTLPSAWEATYDALPPRAKEDLMRAANAALIEGAPVQASEILEAAAPLDPRIARALGAYDRVKASVRPTGSAAGIIADFPAAIARGSVDSKAFTEAPTTAELDRIVDLGREYEGAEVDRLFGEDAKDVRRWIRSNSESAYDKLDTLVHEKYGYDSPQDNFVYGKNGAHIFSADSIKALREMISSIEGAVDDAAGGHPLQLIKEFSWLSAKLPYITKAAEAYSERERIALLGLARAFEDMREKGIDAEAIIRGVVTYTGGRVGGDEEDARLLLERLADYVKQFGGRFDDERGADAVEARGAVSRETPETAARSWRALAERRGDAGDQDLIAASQEAARAPSPASVEDPVKAKGAVRKALDEAEEEWKAVAPFLEPEERAAIETRIAEATKDDEARMRSLRATLACLTVAIA